MSDAELTPVRQTSLWRNRDFLKFWAGETLSLYGAQVTTLALPLTAILVFQASPQQVGLLRFAQLAPYFGLALLFGVWVDRVRRRPVLLAANATRMLLIALVPLLAVTGHLTMTALVAIAGAVGIASVLFDVSWMAYVPTLVRDPKHYLEANAKLSVTASSADVAGPGFAGGLITLLTAPVALIADALSYLASLISLLLIRTPEPRPDSGGVKRRVCGDLRDGLRWVFGHKILRPLALIAPLCNFSLVIVWTMFLLYAARDIGLHVATIGFVLSTASLGGLAGAAISRKVINHLRLGRAYAGSMSAIFLGPALIPLASGPRPVTIAFLTTSFFITYLGLGIANVVMITLRQTCTPHPFMGRMNAAFRTLLFGGGAFGGLGGGFIADQVPLRAALTIVAIGSAALLIPLALSPVSRLRELPAAGSDDIPFNSTEEG